jgi:hypothetical protein
LLEIEAPWLLRLVACSGGGIVTIKGGKVDVIDVVDTKIVSSTRIYISAGWRCGR